MARKPKAASPGPPANRDQQAAFFSYQLGFAGVRFPALAAYFWMTGNGEKPVPPALWQQVERLTDVTRRLGPLLSGCGEGLVSRVTQATQQAWRCFEGGWGNEGHLRNIRRRDGSEPEFFREESMLAGSPLEDPVWEELQAAVEAYRLALPAGVAAWVRLGSLVAAALDPNQGDAGTTGAIAVLQNHLAAMLPEPLLEGLPTNLSHASLETVAELHEGMWTRFTQVGRGPRPKGPAAAPVAPASGAKDNAVAAGFSKEFLAVALLTRHPELTVEEVAARVGCNRTGLYKKPLFREFIKGHRQNRRERPRGFRRRVPGGGTEVDGIDLTDPTEGLDD
jgi:AcrR family transcriptional regulator